MQNIAIALPVGEESDLVSGHLDHDSIARFLVNESALQQTTTKIRPFSHLSYYGETKTRGDQEGTIKATHVLSLVLSRSSYDSIISERPVFCLETLLPRSLLRWVLSWSLMAGQGREMHVYKESHRD